MARPEGPLMLADLPIQSIDDLEPPDMEDDDDLTAYPPPAGIQPARPSDPAEIGYPATLPIEVALNLAPIAEICRLYHITPAQWDRIRHEPLFQEALQNAKDMLAKEGMSFKMKARLQSEELLRTSWALIHNKLVPPNVKADLIKSTVRWAGYEAQAVNNPGVGTGFSININFPEGTSRGRLIENE
jgi:hypothetical protein